MQPSEATKQVLLVLKQWKLTNQLESINIQLIFVEINVVIITIYFLITVFTNHTTSKFKVLIISALDLAISNSMALVYDEVAGVKVWQCLHCNKTNKDKSAIHRHMESHLDGQSHSCGVCYKTYKTRFSLKVHMTREHVE